MDPVTFLGYVAGSLTTLAFVPQVIQAWRSRSTHDISFGMLAVFSLGLTLWLIFGLLILAMPIVIANAVTLCLVMVMIALKLTFQ